MAIYSDIDFFFDLNPATNDISLKTDVESIRQSISNIVHMEKGDKLFSPLFFCGIRSELFEQISPVSADIIQQRIRSAIVTRETRVEDVDVQVTPEPDDNRYSVIITYQPKRELQKVTIPFFLERVS